MNTSVENQILKKKKKIKFKKKINKKKI